MTDDIARLIEWAESQIWVNDPIIKKLAAILRTLNSEEPGTPLGRLAGIARFAQERGLCTGSEAKPAELLVMERIAELEAERDDVVAQLHIAWASVGHNQGVADAQIELNAKLVNGAAAIRAKTIEQCAQLAESYPSWDSSTIADIIRALGQTDESKTESRK